MAFNFSLRKKIDSLKNFIFQLYRAQDLHEEKDRISRAFGAIKDKNILSKILQFSISVSLLINK